MDNLVTRLVEFELRYGDTYALHDAYDDIETELEEDIKDALRQRKYAEILADLAEHMNEEDYEEVNEATELWNDLRAFIAKGE